MNIAKKNGANGGTIIEGRSIGGKNSFKFFNASPFFLFIKTCDVSFMVV